MLSSEYFMILASWSCARQSSVKIEKMFGPPTVPCEQPKSMLRNGSDSPFQQRRWERLVLKSKSQLHRVVFCRYLGNL